MYAFQASEPDSRPPPVSFSPPNAPPISAPLVPALTLAMPQSEPAGERNCSADRTPSVKTALDSPWGTALCARGAGAAEGGCWAGEIGVGVVAEDAAAVASPVGERAPQRGGDAGRARFPRRDRAGEREQRDPRIVAEPGTPVRPDRHGIEYA